MILEYDPRIISPYSATDLYRLRGGSNIRLWALKLRFYFVSVMRRYEMFASPQDQNKVTKIAVSRFVWFNKSLTTFALQQEAASDKEQDVTGSVNIFLLLGLRWGRPPFVWLLGWMELPSLESACRPSSRWLPPRRLVAPKQVPKGSFMSLSESSLSSSAAKSSFSISVSSIWPLAFWPFDFWAWFNFNLWENTRYFLIKMAISRKSLPRPSLSQGHRMVLRALDWPNLKSQGPCDLP